MVYAKMAAPGGLFHQGVGNIRVGSGYARETATGDEWAGRVEFVVAPRGFCLTVESLNDALYWLRIEGAPDQHEAQL